MKLIGLGTQNIIANKTDLSSALKEIIECKIVSQGSGEGGKYTKMRLEKWAPREGYLPGKEIGPYPVG